MSRVSFCCAASFKMSRWAAAGSMVNRRHLCTTSSPSSSYRKTVGSRIITVSRVISLVAKTPMPLFGELRASKTGRGPKESQESLARVQSGHSPYRVGQRSAPTCSVLSKLTMTVTSARPWLRTSESAGRDVSQGRQRAKEMVPQSTRRVREIATLSVVLHGVEEKGCGREKPCPDQGKKDWGGMGVWPYKRVWCNPRAAVLEQITIFCTVCRIAWC